MRQPPTLLGLSPRGRGNPQPGILSRSLARHYRNVPKSPEALRRWSQDGFGRYAEALLFFDDFVSGNEKANSAQET